MDIDLDLEDLSYPATLRVIDPAGEPGAYIRVNQALLDFYGLTDPPHSPADFLDNSSAGLDEVDRRVAANRESVTYNLSHSGRTIELQKNPVMRERVVAVLTLLVDSAEVGEVSKEPARLGRVAESSMESITVLEIEDAHIRIISQNRASLELDRLIESLHGP